MARHQADCRGAPLLRALVAAACAALHGSGGRGWRVVKVHFDELLTAAEAAAPEQAAGPTVTGDGSTAFGARTSGTAPRSDDVEGNLESEVLAGSAEAPVGDDGQDGAIAPDGRQILQSDLADPAQLAPVAGIGAAANLNLSAVGGDGSLTPDTGRPTVGSGADGEGRTVDLVRAQLGTDPSVWVDPRSSQRPWSDLGAVEGLLTFRGNPTRSWYGQGPGARPPDGAVVGRRSAAVPQSAVGSEAKTGAARAGPASRPCSAPDGPTSGVAFGAYDRAVHFLDAATGARVLAPFVTGDIIKGSVTVDPDGFPLLYTGSRDNYFHVLALDRGQPDRAVEAVGRRRAAHAVEQRLGRLGPGDRRLPVRGGRERPVLRGEAQPGLRAPTGKVTVDPQIVFHAPRAGTPSCWPPCGDHDVSIENSVAISGNTVYFANSGGLVQGWDISGLKAGRRPTRVFRFWTGDDTDASMVVDGEGMLYVRQRVRAGQRQRQASGPDHEARPPPPRQPAGVEPSGPRQGWSRGYGPRRPCTGSRAGVPR